MVMTSYVVGHLHLNKFNDFFFVADVDFKLDVCSLIRHQSFNRKHVQYELNVNALRFEEKTCKYSQQCSCVSVLNLNDLAIANTCL